MERADHGLFLTSEGETNRVRIQRFPRIIWFGWAARWMAAIAGMAVLCHPSNFRFPVNPSGFIPTSRFVLLRNNWA